MSIRDVVRRERWQENAADQRRLVEEYEATLVPVPAGGWQAVIDAAFARAQERGLSAWLRPWNDCWCGTVDHQLGGHRS